MTARNRSRIEFETRRSRRYTNGVPYAPESQTNYHSVNDTCNDVIGDYGNDHTFTSNQWRDLGYEPVNGVNPSGTYAGSYVSNSYKYMESFGRSHLSHKTLATIDRAGVGVRTSPNRPYINPLSLAQDLYDLPRMVRSVGQLIRKPRRLLSAKELANVNLMTMFGWLPLIEDAHKLLHAQSHIERRFKRLRKLYDTGGEHRRIRVDEDHVAKHTSFPLWDVAYGLPYFGMDVYQETSVDRWASVRWKLLTRAPEDRSYQHLRSLAIRTTYGLTVEGLVSGVWDLIPWTWIIDWFTNAGDMVSNFNNTVPVTMSSCCLMTQTTTKTLFKPFGDNHTSYSGGSGENTYTSKLRTVLSGTSFNAALPNLGLTEVSILGSLFAQRFLR